MATRPRQPPSQALTRPLGPSSAANDPDATLAEDVLPGGGRALARGESLGRYLIVEPLGTGGMGAVYAAYDPELDRRIAIKLLSIDALADDSGNAAVWRERLVREARAMAQLSHPNVVAVYDVGSHDSDLFIAMEFVPGKTLRDWVRRDAPGADAILDAFSGAGQGLAAAHRAGIVHRDFKPHNVILGADGRARVLDFGIARAIRGCERPELALGTRDDPEQPSSAHGTSSATWSSPLTQAGALVGTPPYMSPEQLAGDAVDHRSDQFSFCVALYEALSGDLPFSPRSSAGRPGVAPGEALPPPPGGVELPGWLRPVLARGLAVDGAQRYPSMDELLLALRRDTRARLRFGTVAVAAIAAGAIVAGALLARATVPVPRCQVEPAELGELWSAASRAEVRSAFAANGGAGAAETFDLIDRALARYRSGWLDARTESCEATRVRGAQSERVLELRMQCLDRSRNRVAGLIDLLAAEVTPATIDKAVRAVADMTRLDACAAAGVIASGPSLPVEPELRARVSELQAELDHVHGLELAGRGEEGSARADRAVASAEALGYGPVLTEALWRRAQLRSTFASDFAGAEADERAALERAAGEQNYALMAEVAVELLGNVGAQQRRFEEARGLQVAAELALRLADSPPLSKARLVTKLGAIKHSQEDFEAAAELFATAARLTAKAAGEDSLDHGFALNNVAVAHLQRGQAQQALPLFEQATRILRSALGPHHPSLAMVLGNAGMIHEQRGHLAEALAAYTAAQEAIAFVGDDHPHVATMLLNRAGVLATMRRGDEGRVLAARGLAAFERLFGPDSQRLARPLLMSASVASLAGDNALAEAHARRALEVIGDDVGQRATAASAHLVVAAAARAQGRAAEALTQAELAAAAIMAQPGADAASLAPALRERGAALLALGRVRASVAVLEDAVRRCEQGPTSAPPQVLVPMRSLFARALWRAGQRERARAVVAKVREDYGRMDCCQTEVAELDAWLAEHTER